MPETYIHRIGRTGRAGANGVAISFCDINEKELLTEIEGLIRMKLTEISDHPNPLTKTHMTNAIAPKKMKAAEEIVETKHFDKKKYRMTASGTLKEKKSNFRGNRTKQKDTNPKEDRTSKTFRSNKPKNK